MNHQKHLRNALLISCAFGIAAYTTFGPRGMVEYFKKRHQVTHKHEKIAELERHIAKLSQAITAAKHHPFALEKTARYDFCMGYTNEMIYVLPAETTP